MAVYGAAELVCCDPFWCLLPATTSVARTAAPAKSTHTIRVRDMFPPPCWSLPKAGARPQENECRCPRSALDPATSSTLPNTVGGANQGSSTELLPVLYRSRPSTSSTRPHSVSSLS